jgi:hypothetical protein
MVTRMGKVIVLTGGSSAIGFSSAKLKEKGTAPLNCINIEKKHGIQNKLHNT